MAGKTLIAFSNLSLIFLFLANLAYCKEILVGGKSNAWKVPSSPSDSLNKWAETLRFHVGDFLVWKYDGEKDSVLRVTKEAYVNCNTTNPAAHYKDGDTKVKLDKPGPFFFISGSKTNCVEGEKLHIIVISPRGHTSGGFFSGSAPSPAPSPSVFVAPVVAPATGAASSSTHRSVILAAVLGLLLLSFFH